MRKYRYGGQQVHPRHSITSNPMGWLTTFNDMITLLMVFFVLLFTMGSTDIKRFRHFQNALQSALGLLHEGENAPYGIIGSQNDLPEPQRPARRTQDGAAEPVQLLDTAATDAQKELFKPPDGIEAQYTPRGIELILEDKLLFRSGSDRLTAPGRQMLDKVIAVVKPLPRAIRVEGHTDNRPILTETFPSNWELSTARAVRVVSYFIDRGGIDPKRLSAAGYGASKPRASNDAPEDRARNRRVEIILNNSLLTSAQVH